MNLFNTDSSANIRREIHLVSSYRTSLRSFYSSRNRQKTSPITARLIACISSCTRPDLTACCSTSWSSRTVSTDVYSVRHRLAQCSAVIRIHVTLFNPLELSKITAQGPSKERKENVEIEWQLSYAFFPILPPKTIIKWHNEPGHGDDAI